MKDTHKWEALFAIEVQGEDKKEVFERYKISRSPYYAFRKEVLDAHDGDVDAFKQTITYEVSKGRLAKPMRVVSIPKGTPYKVRPGKSLWRDRLTGELCELNMGGWDLVHMIIKPYSKAEAKALAKQVESGENAAPDVQGLVPTGENPL